MRRRPNLLEEALVFFDRAKLFDPVNEHGVLPVTTHVRARFLRI